MILLKVISVTSRHPYAKCCEILDSFTSFVFKAKYKLHCSHITSTFEVLNFIFQFKLFLSNYSNLKLLIFTNLNANIAATTFPIRETIFIVLAEGNDREERPLNASNFLISDYTSANKWWWGNQNFHSLR